MGNQLEMSPPIEAFANGGRVYLAECRDCEVAIRLDSPVEVDELITALELAKHQAWPELNPNATS